MILILTIRNADALQEGMAAQFVMEGTAALLGRSRNCNWHLPDPQNAISSRHAEIRRDGESYLLKDISTNGTFLNDGAERLAAEHRLAPGDLVRIGRYEILVSLEAEAAEPAPADTAAEPSPRRRRRRPPTMSR